MKNEGFRRGDVFMAELRVEPGSVEHGRRPVVFFMVPSSLPLFPGVLFT